MCSRDFPACMYTSVYTIVQIILHYAFCAWCVSLYNCQHVFVKKKHFTYFLYLTYFYNNCSSENATFEVVVSENIQVSNEQTYLTHDQVTSIEWPTYAYAAKRSYNICTNFITLDIIWLVTTINLIIGTWCRSNGSWAALLYFPWVLMSFITLIIDITVTSWFASDISHTYGLRKWFNFIGGNESTAINLMDAFFPPINTSMPSIFLVSIFGRILQAAINAYRETDESLRCNIYIPTC
ncbi:hypothetical protein RN001_009972 [Aquatica leii]|uniref:Uncharacterized protein n=1 Tax=Aquatica leii TaxID=1421715 RepID=A0AAN7P8Q7_9COLE|nr:hypothetical protein RN001_009972 [Aquatica leii]